MGKSKTFDGKVWGQKINYGLNAIHSRINALNASKIFAGVMIIVLNIASRFVTIKLSKTMEAYLRHTFSRQALIFAIAWMGTRDIYIAFMITMIFSLFVDILFNEDSAYCILSSDVTEYYTNLSESDEKPSHTNIPGMPQTSQNKKEEQSGEITEKMMKDAKEIIRKWEEKDDHSTDAPFFKVKRT